MDLNGDGFNDILSGCYSQSGHDSMVGSYWVLYGDKEGKFAKPVELQGTDGKLLQVIADLDGTGDSRLTQNICSRPYAVDWDGDGDLDIVAGNFQGTFFVFTGEGKGKFAPKAEQLNDTEGKALKISGVHSDPFIVDWDRDGDLDLVTGSSDGAIYWAENVRKDDPKVTGADRTPVLTALKPLVKAAKASGDAPAPTYGIRIFVADVNGDGKLDILAGDRFSSGGAARSDLTEDEKAAYEKANSEYQSVMQEYSAAYSKLREAYEAAVQKAEEKKGEKLTREEQRALQKEHLTDKIANDETIQKTRARMNELTTEMAKYRTPRLSGGHVWVYEQK